VKKLKNAVGDRQFLKKKIKCGRERVCSSSSVKKVVAYSVKCFIRIGYLQA